MATSEAKEIKKQKTLVRFSIISYKTRLRVVAGDTLSYLSIISKFQQAEAVLGELNLSI